MSYLYDELTSLSPNDLNQLISDSLTECDTLKQNIQQSVLSSIINMKDEEFDDFFERNQDQIILVNERLKPKMREKLFNTILIKLKENCQHPDGMSYVYDRYIYNFEDLLTLEYCCDDFLTCNSAFCDSCKQIIKSLKKNLP